jgi:dimethylamine monooxygenase subunit A
MPFDHTPYDGSKQPFTVGLEPLEERQWLEPDGFLISHLERKEELLRSAAEDVFREEEGTAEAQQEVFELVAAHLKRWHADRYDVSGESPFPIGRAAPIARKGDAALLSAARLVQEDLVLMRAGEGGYRIAVACLCFPSSWSLAEKFGRSMHDIHVDVPGFNTGRMGPVVARIFENLKVGQLLARYNWSIYDDAELHHPQSKRIASLVDGPDVDVLGRLFVRVERQTLRRLERSGDILFTIKIHHDPLALLRKDPRSAVLAGGLRDQLLQLDEDQLAYKGLTDHRNILATALERLEMADAGC